MCGKAAAWEALRTWAEERRERGREALGIQKVAWEKAGSAQGACSEAQV